MTHYGVEGPDWEWATHGEKAMFEDLGYEPRILWKMAYGSVQNSNWFSGNPTFRASDISNTIAWDGDPLDGEYFKAKALNAYWGKGPKEVFAKNKMLLDLSDQEEFDNLDVEIKTYLKEQIAQFVSGKKSVDKDWDGYIKDLKNLSIDRYLELAQKGYDAFNAASE